MSSYTFSTAADACHDGLWCFLDKHEGSGVWATAIAAVGIALLGLCAERFRRRREDRNALRAVIVSLEYAQVSLSVLLGEFDPDVGDKSKLNVDSRPILKMIETIRWAVQHALTLRFSDKELLKLSLETLTTTQVIEAAAAQSML